MPPPASTSKRAGTRWFLSSPSWRPGPVRLLRRAADEMGAYPSGQWPPGNGEFAEAYNEFAVVLDTVRRNTKLASPNGYYPYGTLHILPQILPLLNRHGIDLKTLVAGKAILDVGCGD